MTARYPVLQRPSGTALLEWVNELAPELLPVYNKDYPGRNVVVLGSFKGWYEMVKPYRERLRAAGFYPLAPQGEVITRYANGFEVLDTDTGKIATLSRRLGRAMTEREISVLLEALFITAIRIGDLTYVAGLPRDLDDGTYIGETVSGELGIAMVCGPVYGTEISPTLDDRDGYDGWVSHFAAHVAMIDVVTPEELGVQYATIRT